MKPFAVAPIAGRQDIARDPADLDGLDRYQVVLVELVRNFEENAVPVLFDSGGRKGCPGRIALSGLDPGHVIGFGLEPARNVLEEAGFRERLAEKGFEFRRDRRAVNRGGLFLGYAADGPFLDEFAFEDVKRRERVVTLLMRADLGRYVEQ